MKRKGFRSGIALGLLFAGITGLAIGGIQAVIDSVGVFSGRNGTFSAQAIVSLLLGGIGLIAGIRLFLAMEDQNKP